MLMQLLYRVMRWKQFWFILLWAVVIGARVWLTFSQDFWEDELWSLYFGISPASYTQMLIHPPDDRPPVYHMFARMMTQWQIQGNWLRLPSLLAGIATIWVLYKQTRKTSQLWGVTAVMALGASFLLIDASWQMREYAFLGLVAALQVGMWLNWLQEAENKRFPNLRWWRNWAILSFVGVALNYVYLPFLAAMLISWLGLLVWWWVQRLLTTQHVGRQIFALFCTSIPMAVMAGAYLVSAQWNKMTMTTTWIPQPSVLSVVSLMTTLSNWHNYLWEYRGNMPLEEQRLVSLSFFWVACFVVVQRLLWQQRQRFLWIFNWWAVVVMLLNIGSVVWASYFLNVSVFLPRFFTPLAVVVALVWATYLVALDGVFQPQFRGTMRVIGVFASVLFFLVSFCQVYKIGNVRLENELTLSKLAQTIDRSYQPGDQLVFLPEHYQKIMPLFYFPRTKYPDADVVFLQHNERENSVAQPTQNNQSGKQLFIVVANLLLDPNSDFYEPGGYEADSLAKLQRYKALCQEPNPAFQSGSDYSFFQCLLR
jgi:hypothetical protein